jgi:hypothetical protein
VQSLYSVTSVLLRARFLARREEKQILPSPQRPQDDMSFRAKRGICFWLRLCRAVRSVVKTWVFKINTTRGWEFDQYFRSRGRRPVAMGDEGWIRSASSLRYLREAVKKGDLFLCYETDRKRMVGVARAASDGRKRDLTHKVSLVDFCPPREAVRFENPLTRHPDLDHILAFSPQRGRGTVQPIDRDEFVRLRRIMLRKNPSQVDALKGILGR